MIAANDDLLGAQEDDSPVNLTFLMADPEGPDAKTWTLFRIKPKKVECFVGQDGRMKSIRLIGVDKESAEVMGLGSGG